MYKISTQLIPKAIHKNKLVNKSKCSQLVLKFQLQILRQKFIQFGFKVKLVDTKINYSYSFAFKF